MEISERFFPPDQPLPLVVEPKGEASAKELTRWLQESADAVEEKLLKHGAILFRGFGVKTPGAFNRFIKKATSGPMDYVDGNSPRTKLASGIYTSTEYPAQYFISLHNELSYSRCWPSKIFFCCITAPESRGETVICDSRRLLQELPKDLVEEFEKRQICYIRNLHGGDGFGPSWQATFEMEDRTEVEAHCRDAHTNFEWKPDGGLRVWHVRPALLKHPKTQEVVWFNQADQFHPSTHPTEVYQSLMDLYQNDESNLPQNVSFGDGAEIPTEMLDQVRATTEELSVYFPWQRGDLLMVDNMLVSHGRAPFEGDRKILASMCDPYGAQD